jgi:arylsulfatase
MRFTRAMSNARCMPTRQSLLMGLNPQLVDSNQSRIGPNCITLAEVLKGVGYATYMVGKWHLGLGFRRPDLHQTPTGRGFDRFYGIWHGAAFPTKPKLLEAAERSLQQDRHPVRIVEDGRELEWDEVPEDYYETFTWTDKAIEMIEGTDRETPVFTYVSYTAPHWPIWPKQEYVERYKGRYAEGPDVLRARILENQKREGIFPKDYPLYPRPDWVPGKADMESHEFDKYQSGTEEYYATITEMDTAIGRLVDCLKRTGRYENTLVIFLSDNGADNLIGGPARGLTSDTPFRGFKLTYYEGGPATPFIVRWPGVVPPGTMNTVQEVHLEDVMATVLEITGASYPENYRGNPIFPHQGRSFLRAVQDPNHSDGPRIWVWYHDGQRGVWADPWKAVFNEMRHPALQSYGFPDTLDGWNLYLLDEDRIEVGEMSDIHPEKMKEMIELWEKWARHVGWQPSPRWSPHPSDEFKGVKETLHPADFTPPFGTH